MTPEKRVEALEQRLRERESLGHALAMIAAAIREAENAALERAAAVAASGREVRAPSGASVIVDRGNDEIIAAIRALKAPAS